MFSQSKLVLFTNLFYNLSLKIVFIKIFKDFQIFLQMTASYIACKVKTSTCTLVMSTTVLIAARTAVLAWQVFVLTCPTTLHQL